MIPKHSRCVPIPRGRAGRVGPPVSGSPVSGSCTGSGCHWDLAMLRACLCAQDCLTAGGGPWDGVRRAGPAGQARHPHGDSRELSREPAWRRERRLEGSESEAQR